MNKIERNYGWKPDLPDHRDFKYAVPRHISTVLPPSIDLRPNMPPVYDQGQLGSCTANSIGGAHHFEQIKQAGIEKAFIPSRLMIYYNERDMEGDIDQDNGAQIRDGIKVVNSQGVCPETEWPYDITKFAVKPLVECYTHAKLHPTVSYHSVVQDISLFEQALASGFPMVFGFSVYSAFESSTVASTGVLKMPGAREKNLGGHAVLCVGYNRTKKQVLVRNSWGSSWGQQGYFWMPYAYITNPNLASDFWVIQSVK